MTSLLISRSNPSRLNKRSRLLITGVLALAMGVSGLSSASADPTLTPTITNIEPNTGSTAGGTAITITGTDFDTDATVTVNGVAATSVVVVSSTSITAVTPAGTAGPQDVVVSNVADGSLAISPNGFTYEEPNTITGLSLAPGSPRTYKIGDKLKLQIVFSGEVVVNDTPTATLLLNGGLNLGGKDAVVAFETQTETNTVVVSYLVQEGVGTDYLISAVYGFTPIVDGSIRDLAGIDVSLQPNQEFVDQLTTSLGMGIDQDGYDVTRPLIVSVGLADSSEELYGIGEEDHLLLTFNESITVTGIPTLTLRTPGSDQNPGFDVLLTYDTHTVDTMTLKYTLQEGVTPELLIDSVYSLVVESSTIVSQPLTNYISDVAGNRIIDFEAAISQASSSLNRQAIRNTLEGVWDVNRPVIRAVPDELVATSSASTWQAPRTFATDEEDGLASYAELEVTYSINLGVTSTDLAAARAHLATPGNVVRVTYSESDTAGNLAIEIANFISFNLAQVNGGGSPGPKGDTGPAGPAGASAPTSTVSTQALAIAIANAESATAVANEKAKALDVAKVAAELAKNQALEAAQLAKSNAEKLAVELALLAQKKNSVSVKISGNTSQIMKNLSDEFAKSQAVIQVKKPKTTKYVTLGRTMLNASGDGTFRVKGKIAKGSYIRILIEGVVVKTHIV